MHHDEDADLIPLNHRQRRAEQYKKMGKTGEVRTISRLFVKGLPKEWDETKLADVFSEVGPVRRALLMRTSNGESKGCGLVSYAMVEDAATAISRFNAMKVPGTSIKLLVEVAKKIERKEPQQHGEAQGDDGVAESSEPQQQKSKRPRLSQEDKARTIFIENLPESVSVRRLRRHADRCGSVEEFVYPDKGGLVKSAQGAVTLVQSAKIRFATIKEAEQASDYFFGKVLSKKKHPGFKTKAYQLIAGRRCRLIVRNLPFKARADILQKHFEQCGQVTEVNIPSKPDGTKCGFGFVQFRHPSEAAAAIGKLNASTLLDRSIVVDWSLPKDKFEALKSKQQAEGASQPPPEQFKAAPLPSDDVTDSDDGEDAQDEVDDAQDEGVEAADSEEEAPVKGKKASDLWTPAEPPKPNLQIRRKLDRDVPGASLFIRNISFETTEEDLKEAFEAFAPVRRVLLVRDPITKLPRGNGFVHFRTAEDASRVLEETKDIPSDTKLPIPKKKASPTTHQLIQHLGSSLVVDGRRLILLPSLKREEVKDVTEKRGKTAQSEDSRGLRLAKEGFIEEGTPAAEGLTQSDLNRRKTAWVEKKQKLLNPNFFVSSTRLSIRNLPVSLDEKALKQLVIKQTQQYLIDAGGQPKEVRKRRIVQQVKLPRSSTETETNTDVSDLSVKGKPRGYAFVEFVDHESALACLRILNNNPTIFGPKKRPFVEFALENHLAIQKLNLLKEKLQNSQASSSSQFQPKAKKLTRWERRRLRKHAAAAEVAEGDHEEATPIATPASKNAPTSKKAADRPRQTVVPAKQAATKRAAPEPVVKDKRKSAGDSEDDFEMMEFDDDAELLTAKNSGKSSRNKRQRTAQGSSNLEADLQRLQSQLFREDRSETSKYFG